MAETRECPYCAEELEPDARTCRACGVDLATGTRVDPASKGSFERLLRARVPRRVTEILKLGLGLVLAVPIISAAAFIVVNVFLAVLDVVGL